MNDPVVWDGLALSAGDAIRAYWYDKDVHPTWPTPLDGFGITSDARLQAQAWTMSDTPWLPSNSWWARLTKVRDEQLGWLVGRVTDLVEGRPALLGRRWRDSWRRKILPGLLAEIRRRRQRASAPWANSTTPSIDVLETMQRLTGEEGHERRGEWWFHCPFHPDKTASLSVNAGKGVWKCLGCGRGGGWKALRELAA